VDAADLQAVITDERGRLAGVIDSLSPDQWDQPSLCTGWTVKILVAHIALTSRLTPLQAMRGMVAAGFDINKMIDRSARAHAARHSPAELAAQYRETVASERRPLGTKPRDPLVDVLVHGQDLTRPLGIAHPMPAEHVVPALDFALGASFYGAPKRVAGLRLVATDAEWSTGDGDRELRGPSGDLLLVATGRPTGLGSLEGPGVDELASRLAVT
jgi:uncharacterized protein (TIGR03083 family)